MRFAVPRVTPSVEVNGPERHGTQAAMRSLSMLRLADGAPCRGGSGRPTC